MLRVPFSVAIAAVACVSTPELVAQSFVQHWEFDQAFQPSAALPSIFTLDCGRLVQVPGSCTEWIGGGGSVPVLNPNAPIMMEARLRVAPASGTQVSFAACLGAFPVIPAAGAAPPDRTQIKLMVDPVFGYVCIHGAEGNPALWINTAGVAFDWHTYRLEGQLGAPFTWQARLFVDDVLVQDWVGAPYFGLSAPYPHNGWAMGHVGTAPCHTAGIDWDNVTISQVDGGVGEANAAGAALFIDRDEASAAGAIGFNGPFLRSVVPGTSMKIEWNGPPGMPFALFAGPMVGANLPLGCAGNINIGSPPSLADTGIVFDPSGPAGWLFTLDNCGYASQTLNIPGGLPIGVSLIGFQGLVFQATGSCPYLLTAAYDVRT